MQSPLLILFFCCSSWNIQSHLFLFNETTAISIDSLWVTDWLTAFNQRLRNAMIYWKKGNKQAARAFVLVFLPLDGFVLSLDMLVVAAGTPPSPHLIWDGWLLKQIADIPPSLLLHICTYLLHLMPIVNICRAPGGGGRTEGRKEAEMGPWSYSPSTN